MPIGHAPGVASCLASIGLPPRYGRPVVAVTRIVGRRAAGICSVLAFGCWGTVNGMPSSPGLSTDPHDTLRLSAPVQAALLAVAHRRMLAQGDSLCCSRATGLARCPHGLHAPVGLRLRQALRWIDDAILSPLPVRLAP